MNAVIQYIISNGDKIVSARQLAEMFMISDLDVRTEINRARCEGVPICSCGKGYYYSEKREDIEKTIRSLQHRVSKMQSAMWGLSKSLEVINETV